MRLERHDGAVERRLCIAMIVDKTALGRIASKWRHDMLRAKWSNRIAQWCVDYYRRHQDAPGKRILHIFENWAETAQDKDTIDLTEKFLVSLSNEWEELEREANPGFTIDQAATYLNHVAAERLAEAISGDLALGKVDDALKRIHTFGKVEMGVGSGIDVLQDEEAMLAAFADRPEALIVYPDPLGKFVGDAFSRDAFIAFAAPDKRGKCLEGITEVLQANGNIRTIKAIVESKDDTPVVVFNEKSQRMESVKVSHFHTNGEKKCWKITTRTGKTVTATANHPLLTADGWRELREIQVGDFVASAKRLPNFGEDAAPIAEVRFLAYMMADGGVSAGTVIFSKLDKVLVAGFKESCAALGFGVTQVTDNDYRLTGCFVDFRKRMHLWKVKSKNKVLPEWLFRCPKEQIREFLKIFFSCDGSTLVTGMGFQIELTLASEKMLMQIGHLLTRFGIVHRIYRNDVALNGKVYPAWRLSIASRDYVNLFLREIGMMSYKDAKPLKPKKSRSFLDKFPHPVASRFMAELEEEYPDPEGVTKTEKGKHLHKWWYLRRVMGKRKMENVKSQLALGRHVMRQSFMLTPPSPAWDRYMGADILWDEVESIEEVGLRQTYDITIPKHHNFVANDMVVHNSMCLMDLAWRGMEQRRRVAYFEAGDMSQNQVLRRFYTRAAELPRKAGPVKVPIDISRAKDDEIATVEFETRELDKINWRTAKLACDKVMKDKVRSKQSYLKLVCHPAKTLTVPMIEGTLDEWERDGWGPVDTICIDYADLLVSPYRGKMEPLHEIDEIWAALRGLAQKRHCLVVTATQTNAAAYKAKTLDKSHFSGNKLKNAHVSGILGLSQSRAEKELQIVRWSWLVLREDEFHEGKCIHLAQCLALAQPAMLSCL